MGFGLDSIGNAFKGAVSGAVNAVGDVAKKVEGGAEQVEQKVAGVVRSAIESLKGVSGFDGDNNPGLGPLAESKPKGGSASTQSNSGTAYA